MSGDGHSSRLKPLTFSCQMQPTILALIAIIILALTVLTLYFWTRQRKLPPPNFCYIEPGTNFMDEDEFCFALRVCISKILAMTTNDDNVLVANHDFQSSHAQIKSFCPASFNTIMNGSSINRQDLISSLSLPLSSSFLGVKNGKSSNPPLTSILSIQLWKLHSKNTTR